MMLITKPMIGVYLDGLDITEDVQASTISRKYHVIDSCDLVVNNTRNKYDTEIGEELNEIIVDLIDEETNETQRIFKGILDACDFQRVKNKEIMNVGALGSLQKLNGRIVEFRDKRPYLSKTAAFIVDELVDLVSGITKQTITSSATTYDYDPAEKTVLQVIKEFLDLEGNYFEMDVFDRLTFESVDNRKTIYDVVLTEPIIATINRVPDLSRLVNKFIFKGGFGLNVEDDFDDNDFDTDIWTAAYGFETLTGSGGSYSETGGKLRLTLNPPSGSIGYGVYHNNCLRGDADIQAHLDNITRNTSSARCYLAIFNHTGYPDDFDWTVDSAYMGIYYDSGAWKARAHIIEQGEYNYGLFSGSLGQDNVWVRLKKESNRILFEYKTSEASAWTNLYTYDFIDETGLLHFYVAMYGIANANDVWDLNDFKCYQDLYVTSQDTVSQTRFYPKYDLGVDKNITNRALAQGVADEVISRYKNPLSIYRVQTNGGIMGLNPNRLILLDCKDLNVKDRFVITSLDYILIKGSLFMNIELNESIPSYASIYGKYERDLHYLKKDV